MTTTGDGSVTRWVAAVWRIATEYWNSILAAVSVAGFALTAIIPDADEYTGFFLFLGANAVVWTVVEMRHMLRTRELDRDSTYFSSMREAREMIIGELLRELERPGRGTVVIVGGRVRSIIEIVREFSDRLSLRPPSPGDVSGLEMTIYMMDPGFLQTWKVPGDLDADERTVVGRDFAAQVTAAQRELASLAQRSSMTNRHISVSIRTYSSYPFAYFFLFGDESILWGGFTWRRETCDLEGPSNPCELVRRGSPAYAPLRGWLTSRAQLLEAQQRLDFP